MDLLRKVFNLWRFALGNLRKNIKRTLAVLVPLSIVMVIASSYVFVKDGLILDAKNSVQIIPDVTVQKVVAGRPENIHLSFMDNLINLPHVRLVIPRVWGYVPVSADGEILAYTIVGIDLEKVDFEQSEEIKIKKGRHLKQGDPQGCLVGEAMAEKIQLDIGDNLCISDIYGNESQFYIRGIFSSPAQIFSGSNMMVPIETAREFFNFSKNEASDLALYLKNPNYADIVAADISSMFHNIRVFTRQALSDLTVQSFGEKAGVFQIVWMVLLVTSALIAFAQASNITPEMKKEIGILKAIGWGIGDIITLKMFEVLCIIVIGVGLGWGLTIVYLLLDAPGVKEYFLGWGVLFPDFPLPFNISWKSLFLLFCIGGIPVLFATVVPSWLTGIVDPDDAIRKG